MNIIKKLQNKRVVIATHVYATGPSFSLEDYLKNKVASLLLIGHPFVYAKDTRSFYRFYKNGKVTKQHHYPFTVTNQVVSIMKDTLLSIFLAVKYGKCDVFVGVDSANACAGIFLKWMGVVDHVIFYTIDYVPERFTNKLLNTIYHMMDSFAVKRSDIVWNLSEVMAIEREKRGISKVFRKKQIVVPVGTESHNLSLVAHKTKKYHIAHMGHLIKKQGVQLILDAIPLIKKKIPSFHLEVIGGGEYEVLLKKQVKKLGISRFVTFHGFVKSHDDVAKILAYCQLGVAPYTDTPDNYVRYTDPGKVKAYLAVGLPVIITKVPEVYKYIERKKCGIAVGYKIEELADAISSLLLARNKLAIYQKNARSAAKEFSWDIIFSKALIKSL